MAGRQRFGKLKDHATKSFKFDQSKLMSQADEIMVNYELMKRGIDQSKWEGYGKNIGACSVFAGIWLADSLVGRREIKSYMSEAEKRQNLTAKSIGLNAELKETADNISNALLVRKLNLQVGLPTVLNDLSNLKHERSSRYYFIACEGENSWKEKVSHAVAYSHRDRGTFFDPNAGEYINVDPTAFMFFQEWAEVYHQDFFGNTEFNKFICFPVC